MPRDINTTLTQVAAEFTRQLTLLRSRCGREAGYETDKLQLAISVSHGKVDFELTYCQGYGNNVKAATLGALMDEVWRRAGFDDREAGALQAQSDALRALPAPEPTIAEDEEEF